jgi:hypothetical protein
MMLPLTQKPAASPPGHHDRHFRRIFECGFK